MNVKLSNRRCVILTISLLALLTSSAHATAKKQYDVFRRDKKIATVATSADREAVSVFIYRQGQPAHLYRTYPQAAATVVRIGRRDLFTHYIDAKSIVADDFNFRLDETSGPVRRARNDVRAIAKQLEEDMLVLRAVRGFDRDADVLLAELAYVVLTYNDSIIDGATPPSFSVREVAPASSSNGENGNGKQRILRAAAKPSRDCKLSECKSTCDGQYSECQADQGVADKTACHNNRTSCTSNCYKACASIPQESAY